MAMVLEEAFWDTIVLVDHSTWTIPHLKPKPCMPPPELEKVVADSRLKDLTKLALLVPCGD